MKKLMLVVFAASTLSAFAGGFALNQASAKATAMGGAVMGKAVDGSAVFYNPATMSDFKSTTITVGTIIEKPYADVSVNGVHQGHMDPGTFLLPHAYLIQPIGESGFTFGMGIAPEYGIGSKYRDSWDLAWNTTETTVQGVVFSPNLSYDITEDWSVAAGFRLLYFTFEQYQSPNVNRFGYNLAQADAHLKGDNGCADWGWEVSTRYKILDNLSIGAMYRSYIDTRVRGKLRTRAKSVNYGNVQRLSTDLAKDSVSKKYGPMAWDYALTPAQRAAAVGQAAAQIKSQLQQGVEENNGRGGANIRLPQQVSVGINWDPVETVHLGYTMMWTGWSDLESLHFDLPGDDKDIDLGWRDTFRFGVGAAWDFAEDWTWMISYVYDMDPSSEDDNRGSTMLPAGNRHMAVTGLAWTWGDFEIAACYGLVFMKGENQKYWDADNGETAADAKIFKTNAGYSHQAGVTLTYRF